MIASLIDWNRIRQDFPILNTTVRGHPLCYLDNAATSQKPQAVLDALDHYWATSNANIHRGVHTLSQRATTSYDSARESIRVLLNARSACEVILTKGCTEAINLVAQSWGRSNLRPGDVVLVSTMEHHSNIVPWQLVAEQTGASVLPIPISDDGVIDLNAYRTLLDKHPVKMVGVAHVSNALGTIHPVVEMTRLAHEAGARVLIDGAQAGPHLRIDVLAIDADFYTLSCHKIYAPTGVGVLYGREALLQAMPPYHGGGDMIRTVSFEGTTYADLPAKFEAGTPNIAGVIGLGAAIEYLASLSDEAELGRSLDEAFAAISEQETALAESAIAELASIPGIKVYGPRADKTGIVSFTIDGVHPHDIGTVLDSEGVAIRAGHHCCMPLMKRLGISSTARASFSFMNNQGDVDRLVAATRKAQILLG